jgi:hypothetical protein
MNRATFIAVVLCWFGSTLKLIVTVQEVTNMEQSPLSLLSILFHNLACRSNSEIADHVHNITYGGQGPIPRTSKFMSIYCIYDPFEGNVQMIIRKRKLLVSCITISAVTKLRTWKID